MARTKKTQVQEYVWAVVKYTDGLISVCHSSDVNQEDERIEIISEHDELEEAIQAQRQYAEEKKLKPQY